VSWIPITNPLDSVLTELEQFGKANDASTTERPRHMLNITRDTGAFLAVLVRATLARRVLEIGTSNGYSTLWLASAARAIGGSVTTVEVAEYKIGLASANFTRAGLALSKSAVQRLLSDCLMSVFVARRTVVGMFIGHGRI
jgi:predicted O-methyltransferase YrrM